MEPGIHKDNDNASVSSAAVAGKKPPFKKLILGKDGKPYYTLPLPCTCVLITNNSFF
jgi:hypothetical protein